MLKINKLNIFFLSFLRYRIHISFLYFLILQKFWIKYVHGEINWPVVFSFSIWHFGLYLFDRVYDCEKDFRSQNLESVPLNQKKVLLFVSVFLLLLPFLILIFYNLSIIPYLIIFPFGFFYTVPFYPFKKRFKDLFLIKNFYSAVFIWTLSIFWSIFCYAKLNISEISEYNRFFQLLIITFIIEVIWDIRDIESDIEFGIKTLPNTIGVSATKIIILILLIFCFLFFHTSFVTFLSLCFVVLLANKKISNIIYHIPLLLNVIEFYLK